ncbi:alpha/beta fold hydrolase [Lysinibacillus odysseyi]|uniref:AB hydrolase-1 domain-containing protein n=1 Tax=Lysinibacillus odysseyi 34hs-1 = NBRC 100172 TaxID=1220589 RepID=A0A0A3ILQ7_9BACI|nr:alpha/beta hydrolase [Lysinibacillus odysseyi]KGR84385.1 hypothetical protein CD32_12395 [Lysinibacillus odysseyi 34hs-1 = NBRC 100172]
MKYKTSDGVELYVEKGGKGAPCLFLHGGPGYWSRSFQYHAGDVLENDLEMIYLDQRGCGRSEHSLDYSLNRLIADIEELRESLNIEEWYVMGHSFGGILAVNYAYRFHERTKGLILSNVTLSMRYSFEHQLQKGRELLGQKEKGSFTEQPFIDAFYEMVSELLEKDLYFKLQYKNPANKEKMDIIDREGLASDPQFQHYVFSSGEYFEDFTVMTQHITKPVLVLTGVYDDAVGPDHYKSFRFPNAEVRILEGAHHPYVESREEFQEAIVHFIQRQE